ncbi:MAG: TraR/DksA family transcriptional regulator [Vicinamibacterales bacterium]
MDVAAMAERLREEERVISSRIEQVSGEARDAGDDGVRDSGDAAVLSENTDDRLRGTEMDRGVLSQIRAALARIDAGTYGACVIDGEPIEEARLEAVPWTPYCLEHQEMQERATTL